MYLPMRLTATALSHTPGKRQAGKAIAQTAKASPARKGGTPAKRKR